MPPDERRKPLTRTEALRLAGRSFEADAAQRAYARNRPPIAPFTTTLWDYPSRSYRTPSGSTQGDQRYAGSTPGWVIWQLLHRYTTPGQVVLDPMCGSGTTLDVCRDLGRTGIGFDLSPQRPDIAHADARRLPVPDASADFVFIDPPYSTHIAYSDDPRCIGTLDALERHPPTTSHTNPATPHDQRHPPNAYYAAMDTVIAEIHRALRPAGHAALYVSDTFRKPAAAAGPTASSGFEPIGFELFAMLRRRFTPIDIVAVVRRNAKLSKANWHKSAQSEGFLMRGFNYLFIMRKDR